MGKNQTEHTPGYFLPFLVAVFAGADFLTLTAALPADALADSLADALAAGAFTDAVLAAALTDDAFAAGALADAFTDVVLAAGALAAGALALVVTDLADWVEVFLAAVDFTEIALAEVDLADFVEAAFAVVVFVPAFALVDLAVAGAVGAAALPPNAASQPSAYAALGPTRKMVISNRSLLKKGVHFLEANNHCWT